MPLTQADKTTAAPMRYHSEPDCAAKMQLSSRDPLSLHKLSAGIVATEGGKLTALPIRGNDIADLPHAIAAKTKGTGEVAGGVHPDSRFWRGK